MCLSNKPFYSVQSCVCLCFHTQQLTCGSAHLLFGHMRSLPVVLWFSEEMLRCKPVFGTKKKTFLFLSLSLLRLLNFSYISSAFLPKCSFTSTGGGPCLGSVPESQRLGPPSSTPGCGICHYEVFGFATWSQHTCVHMCVPIIAGIPHLLSLLFSLFTGQDLAL